MAIAVRNYRGNIMDLLLAHDYEVSNEVVNMATYDMDIVEWLMKERVCTITPGAYITTIEHDMHEQECLNVLNCLHDQWGFDIGFKSFEELMGDDRWNNALQDRDTLITQWFQDHLA